MVKNTHNTPNTTKKNIRLTHPLLIIPFVILIASVFALVFLQHKTASQDTVTITENTTGELHTYPSPTPKPIPAGPMSMTIMTGKKTGPIMKTFTVDPYDPAMGTEMTMRVTLQSRFPVTGVTAEVRTDTKSVTIPLGEVMEEDGILTYEGIWMVDDTYLYTYQVELTATDDQGEETVVTPTLR